MTTILEAIRKKKEENILTLSSIREFVLATVESTLENRLSKLEKQVKSELLEQIGTKIKEIENKPLDAVLTRIGQLKGEPGDKPSKDELSELIKPLIPDPPTKEDLTKLIQPLIPPPIKGDRGDNYILTNNDKQEIAKSIKVPIVEKVVEIVKEPTVTEIVKEIAKHETPTEIADKINTLEERIEPKVIKGLVNYLKVLQRAMREKSSGGGGMGNWITEAPSGTINGVNTSFTITNGVAGGGRAIILLYNGQVQEYTNHFTVSGKTITMLFAPETGTYLFAMYVRG